MRTLGGSPNMSAALEQGDDASEGLLVEAAADFHDVPAPQIHRNRFAPLRRRPLRHLYWQQRERRLRSDQRGGLALELGLTPANALRHQAALLREPLNRLAAPTPRAQDAARLVLGPLTSVCHGGVH